MGIKQLLKSIPLVKLWGRKINSLRIFRLDSKCFNDYYLESMKDKGEYKYAVMLLVHSLEKGMCMPNPRPYGFDKVYELMKYLKNTEKKQSFEYELGISVLYAWIDYFDKHQWTDEQAYGDVRLFLNDKQNPNIDSGCKEYNPTRIDWSEQYYDIISSRHAVRDFRKVKIRQEDIDFAINCFLETPTACNRQMCGLVYINDTKIKEYLEKRIIGLSGFNKPNTQYFIITYDLSALAYLGERNQGMFNAGLCTTNFINALHSRGIGTCCLQWSNNPTEDFMVRKALGLSDSERIAVVIAAGYYKKNNIVPCSVRKTKKDIFRSV